MNAMGSLTRHFRLFVAAERARLREGLLRAAVATLLLVMSGLLFVFALGFGLFGAYRSLTEFWPPWQAGLAIAGALSVVALVLLSLVLRRRRPGKYESKATLPQAGPGEQPETPRQAEAESAMRFGEALGRTIKRCGTGPGDLILVALLAGVVLGASSTLRGTARKEGGKCEKRDDP